MTITITGSTGFVGQAVLDLCTERDIAIRALARSVPDERSGVEWVSGDLDDRDALGQLVAGSEAIIHIAGLTNTPDTAEFESVNVGGTRNLIEVAKDNAVKRFVFVSSLAARKPELSAYGASKAKAEELVRASGLDWTIVRPPAVYGPRDRDMFELFKSARLGVIPMPPKGATSVIHVDDLAALLVGLIPSLNAVRHKIFEPDDGREGGWSHQELGRAIGLAMGKRPWVPHLSKFMLELAATGDRLLRGDKAKLTPDRIGYMIHPNWVSRFDRAVPDTVWTPQIETREGLRDTAAWYRAQGWL